MSIASGVPLTLRIRESKTVILINVPWNSTVREVKAAVVARLNALRFREAHAPSKGAQLPGPNGRSNGTHQPTDGSQGESNSTIHVLQTETGGYVDPIEAAMMASMGSASGGLSIAQPAAEPGHELNFIEGKDGLGVELDEGQDSPGGKEADARLPAGVRYTVRDIRLHLERNNTVKDKLNFNIFKIRQTKESSDEVTEPLDVINTSEADFPTESELAVLEETEEPSNGTQPKPAAASFTGPLPDSFILTKIGVQDYDFVYLSLRNFDEGEGNWYPITAPDYAPLYEEEEFDAAIDDDQEDDENPVAKIRKTEKKFAKK